MYEGETVEVACTRLKESPKAILIRFKDVLGGIYEDWIPKSLIAEMNFDKAGVGSIELALFKARDLDMTDD